MNLDPEITATTTVEQAVHLLSLCPHIGEDEVCSDCGAIKRGGTWVRPAIVERLITLALSKRWTETIR